MSEELQENGSPPAGGGPKPPFERTHKLVPGFKADTSMIAKPAVPTGAPQTFDDGHGGSYHSQVYNATAKEYRDGTGPKKGEPRDYGSGDASGGANEPTNTPTFSYPPWGGPKKEPTPKPVRG
jgi:hypothetical protein